MRVKLSYSVDSEDVLKEVAKIINLQAEDLQEALTLFGTVQQELRGDRGTEPKDKAAANISLAQEMLGDFRKALLNIDTRLEEVTEIISGYDDYLHSLRTVATTEDGDHIEEETPEAPEVEDE